MLVLRFQVGDAHYALDGGTVAEVLPLVAATPIPHVPAAVAGVFSHHGRLIPAIDLSRILADRPADRRLSTRLVLVHYPLATGGTRLLGLITERLTRTERRTPSEFTASGVTADAAPYLGRAAADDRGVVQWVDLGALLPPAVQHALFQESAEVPCSSPPSANC